MNTAAPELAPLFRSDAQGELLARVLLNPGVAFTTAEVSRILGLSYASTHREVERLIRMGLVTEERVGRAKRVRADVDSPAYLPLVDLLNLTYGPAVVLAQVLADVAGIEKAFIFGSWAARRAGEPGSPPIDIDVLVVGNPARAQLYAAAERAERRLGREVNTRAVSAEAWAASTGSFLQTVQKRPLVELELRGEDR